MTKVKREREEPPKNVQLAMGEWLWMEREKSRDHLHRLFHGTGRRVTVKQFRQLVYRLGGFPKSTSTINKIRDDLKYNNTDNTVLIGYSDVRLLTHPDEESYWEEKRTEYGEETIRRDTRYQDYVKEVMETTEKAADDISQRNLREEYIIRQADEEKDEKILGRLLRADVRPRLRGLESKIRKGFRADTSADLHEELTEELDEK